MTGTNSADRILNVLELFTDKSTRWTAEEMIEKLGYTRPTMYRYLRSLRDVGLVSSIGNSGYSLGPRATEMDYLIAQSDPLVGQGLTQLKALTATYRCTALLVKWYGEKLLCVASDYSTPLPITSYPRGKPMPITRGAISRSIIAHLPRGQLLKRVERHFLTFKAIGLGTTKEDIVKSFQEIKRKKIATAREEITSGSMGIAHVVLDSNNFPLASICVTIVINPLSEKLLPNIINDVREKCEILTEELSES
jgi:DNA-binding IclR family transcriptional regulator